MEYDSDMKKQLLFLLALSGCASAGSSSKDDLDMYLLRPATREEGQRLKRCLQAVHKAEVQYTKQRGRAPTRVADLPVEEYCDDIKLSLEDTEDGKHEIQAYFHEGESTVRWSVNPRGVIEEHMDPDQNMDLEF